MPVDAKLALSHYAGDLSQTSPSAYQVIRHMVLLRKIRRSDVVPKEFILPFSLPVEIQVSEEYSKSGRTIARKPSNIRPIVGSTTQFLYTIRGEFVQVFEKDDSAGHTIETIMFGSIC